MKYNFNTLKISVTTILIASCGSLFAQNTENLVENGSFESTDGKAKKLGAIQSSKGWVSPTGQPADFFQPSTKTPDINTSGNFYGKEDAKDGSHYAGIVGFSLGDKLPRSYVTAKLNVPLKKGVKYCVTFYVSLSEASMYASNQIGAQFTKKDRAIEGKTSMIEDKTVLQKTAVYHFNNKVFSGMYGWEKVCGVFTAEGGEKFITIGNFHSNSDTKNEKVKKAKDNKFKPVAAAYYYIDDVSVKLIEKYADCDCTVPEEVEEGTSTIYQKVFKINEKMTPKEKIEVYQTYFGFGQTEINQVGKTHLDEIAKMMLANPKFKLQVMGHSDSLEVAKAVEKPKFAEMDSKRVNAVMAYLISKGVPENRLIPSPQGSEIKNEEIIESDDNDSRMAKNRRVAFKVREE
jgi:outer membrane protein OmpA-like peptidoglycan-associated protein